MYFIIKKKFPHLLKVPEVAAFFRSHNSQSSRTQDVELGNTNDESQNNTPNASLFQSILEVVNETQGGRRGNQNTSTVSQIGNQLASLVSSNAQARSLFRPVAAVLNNTTDGVN